MTILMVLQLFSLALFLFLLFIPPAAALPPWAAPPSSCHHRIHHEGAPMMFGQRKSRFPVLHPRFKGDLLVDRNGRLWIGTPDGLWDFRDYRYVPMRARYVARAHGPVHYLYADTASALVTLSADLKAAQALLSGSIGGVR